MVATTPVSDADTARDEVPAATLVLGPADIDRTGIPSLTDAILEGSASATVNDVEGNPFQPDILFRGFTASPVAGTPEGLAVYVDGARFNDAFGDTVNWDLIPPSAIRSAAIESANPIFGLNALGGSVNVRLKTGFTDSGGEATVSGGSFGRRGADVSFGRQAGAFAIFVSADVTHDNGFRQTGASDLARLYADLGWRTEISDVHLGLTAAHDTLGNPGATPVQALNLDRSSIFTAPNSVDNQYLGVTLGVAVHLGAELSLQANAYGQTLTQRTPNGITTEVAPCADGGGLLCNPDGTLVTGPGGAPVPDFLSGGLYSGLSTQLLVTHAYGAAAQVTATAPLAGHANHLVAGLAYDGSDAVFAGTQAIGGFDPISREFVGPGVVQVQPSEGVNPVRVLSVTRAWSLFATDVVAIWPHLDLTMAARFNEVRIGLADQLGGPVNGRHDFSRINPSLGLTWRVAPGLNLYGDYAETSRTPTPQELSCASAANPCSLLNFFVGDPDLRQVVARTLEGGARGEGALAGGHWNWDVAIFHTESSNDILYEAAPFNPNLAFYANAGRTLRQGVEAQVAFQGKWLGGGLSYALMDATFRTPLLLNGGSNPGADANGQIAVIPGDRIPGIPRHRVSLKLAWTPTDRWTLGLAASAQSAAYRFGDEANLEKPVGGYAVLDLNAAYRLSRATTLFVVVKNALDTRYDTYGSFGPVGDVPWPAVPVGVTDPRTASPGAPLTAYGGARLRF